jgi:hypothetical protein
MTRSRAHIEDRSAAVESERNGGGDPWIGLSATGVGAANFVIKRSHEPPLVSRLNPAANALRLAPRSQRTAGALHDRRFAR